MNPDPSHAYLLHPSAPLVFGTGKPLDFGLGGDTLAFPFPSTLAGAVRAAASASESRAPDPYHARDTLCIGPATLARLKSPDMAFDTLLWPRPADAVCIGGKVVPLRPTPVPAGQHADLPAGLEMLELAERFDAKPDRAPTWWTTKEIELWLAGVGACEALAFKGDAGTRPVPRAHVVIEAVGAKGAEQGGLFRTTGQDFGPVVEPTAAANGGYAIALGSNQSGLERAARRVGGEGRFVRFDKLDALVLPAAPQAAAQRIRFVLITPAVFETHGWCPDWVEVKDEAFSPVVFPGTSVKVKLVAAAITRAQSYSGWQPGPATNGGTAAGQAGRPWRVVPAGSVFWFDVVQGKACDLHGRSLCQGQWLRDGWGYGVVGIGRNAT